MGRISHFTLREADIHDGTYIYDTRQPILMLCCVEQTSDCVDQRRDIRLTEMSPTVHPSRALRQIDLGQSI